MDMRKQQVNILNLFENNAMVKICAPMVRYSKLQFRNLVKEYGCDICYTPMILADSFCQSNHARNNEFTTNIYDTGLITQFAANTVHDFVGAAHLASPFCDGVDLNCGCPQRWAKQQGIGCIMLDNPELIYDLVHQCRNRISRPFTVSVKMRLLKDIRKSVEICKQLEKCGVSFVTIHGRTASQTTGQINDEALKIVTENIRIPVVANGGIKTLDNCYEIQKSTGCKGVMVANGILTNPSLFAGSPITTLECVKKWLNICYNSTLKNNSTHSLLILEKPNNLTFQTFHHHLVFMLEKLLARHERRIFNNLQTFKAVLDFLEERFGLKPQAFDNDGFFERKLLNLDYTGRTSVYEDLKPEIKGEIDDFNSVSETEGVFFRNKVEADSEDDNWCNIFEEND